MDYKPQKTIVFGCLPIQDPQNPNAVATLATEQYPISLGDPGTEVILCALNEDVTINFPTHSPFTEIAVNTPFTILNGNFLRVTVAPVTKKAQKFIFTLTPPVGVCATAANVGPEMIVP